MKVTKWVKPLLIVGSALALTACASYGKHGSESTNSGYTSSASSSAQTRGAGDEGLYAQRSNRYGNSANAQGCPKDASDCYYFAFNQSKVNRDAGESIQGVANYLMENPRETILIVGNTDARGSRKYNLALGERRAKAVIALLKAQGVENNIKMLSYGSEKPWKAGDSEQAYSMNRRVDIIEKAIS